MEFKDNLKDLRKEKHWTQKQLAQIINVSDDCIYFWEKGRSEPSICQILQLAEIFDVSTDVLLGKED